MWDRCVDYLQDELPAQQFNTWIRPLKAEQETNGLRLLAPNRFIRDWVADKFMPRILELVTMLSEGVSPPTVVIEVHDRSDAQAKGFLSARLTDTATVDQHTDLSIDRRSIAVDTVEEQQLVKRQAADNGMHLSNQAATVEFYKEPDMRLVANTPVVERRGRPRDNGFAGAAANSAADANRRYAPTAKRRSSGKVAAVDTPSHQNNLIPSYRFDNFVEGKSNQLARAAAMQVVENPGGSYNPLFLYGGVGLGKTHLMHAVGNALQAVKPNAKVVYLHSERFVADMVKALQLNAINDFKRYYRSVDALLIDDIQFFANKERSQEEFFHTFNALLEGGQQMILTCDRYPKEIRGVEERLKSRFGWGLTVSVEPPELETRVAILMAKAEQAKMDLPPEAAFFLAQRVRSNVRELEGALKRVIASAHFTKCPIDVPLIKESLKDLLALQDKQVSIDNIQRTAAEYYKIKVADLMSKRRSRSVARPRQVAMALAKELTNHSLPEIGDAFGGRDHTTVLHACRKIKELRDTNSDIREDYQNLLRTLAT